MLFAKLALLLLYYRIFAVKGLMKIGIYFGAVVIGGFYLACSIAHIVLSRKRVFHCHGGLQFGFGSLHLHFAAPSIVQATDVFQAEAGSHSHFSYGLDVSGFRPCITLSHVHD